MSLSQFGMLAVLFLMFILQFAAGFVPVLAFPGLLQRSFSGRFFLSSNVLGGTSRAIKSLQRVEILKFTFPVSICFNRLAFIPLLAESVFKDIPNSVLQVDILCPRIFKYSLSL